MARLESTKRAKLKTAKQHQPSQKSKSLTCCYILTTSFLGYPLPRSHRHGGFEKKMFPSTSYSFLFQIKAVAHMIDRSANMYRSICNIHVCMHIYIYNMTCVLLNFYVRWAWLLHRRFYADRSPRRLATLARVFERPSFLSLVKLARRNSWFFFWLELNR